MSYIKQLDSIRAIAVFMVIIWHWTPRTGFMEGLHINYLGVNIFFVLSGFLITRILLVNRSIAEEGGNSKTNLLKNFYVRRMLRIFPIYYLTIFLTVALSKWLELGVTKTEVLSNLTYTSNYFIYFSKAWHVASLHFWSLAVEEQFYLAWPLLMLFWPRKYLVPVFFLSIAIGLLSQLLVADPEFGHLPTTTCLDCFGAGGLLAYITVHRQNNLQKTYRHLTMLSVAGVVMIVITWQFDYYFACIRFIHTIIACWIIGHILVYREKRSAFLSLLNNRLLMAVGKVSYGIYLYHMLYLYVASYLWYRVFEISLAAAGKKFEPWIFFMINLGILYLIAWLSWRFIEKPILSFKHRFKYKETRKGGEVQLSEVSQANVKVPVQV